MNVKKLREISKENGLSNLLEERMKNTTNE